MRGSASAPLLQRALAQVFARQFQQVVGHHARRCGGQCLGPGLEPLDARLQRGKRHWQGLFGLPGQQLAIDDGAVRQLQCGVFDFGETSIQTLFAARPQRRFAGAANQLQADAVPFPFQQPVVDGAQRVDLRFQRRCQKERIGLLAVAGQFFAGQQVCKIGGMRPPTAEHALRNARDIHPRQFGQRLLHEPLRHPNPQCAGQQLVEHQPLVEGQAAPRLHDAGLADLHVLVGDRQQPLFDLRGVAAERVIGQAAVASKWGQCLFQCPWCVALRAYRQCRRCTQLARPFRLGKQFTLEAGIADGGHFQHAVLVGLVA